MTNTQSAETLWYTLALLLPVSALLSRSISFRHGFGLALFWIAIFASLAGTYGYRHRIASYFTETAPSGSIDHGRAIGARSTSGAAQAVRIEQAPDGHFWVDGEINGHPARFMIDSGATITALSSDLAKNAGLNVDWAGPGVALRTANGAIVAHRSSVASLSIGNIQTSDLGIVVADAFGDINVLGMNFLSRLRSWRVENGEMVLES